MKIHKFLLLASIIITFFILGLPAKASASSIHASGEYEMDQTCHPGVTHITGITMDWTGSCSALNCSPYGAEACTQTCNGSGQIILSPVQPPGDVASYGFGTFPSTLSNSLTVNYTNGGQIITGFVWSNWFINNWSNNNTSLYGEIEPSGFTYPGCGPNLPYRYLRGTMDFSAPSPTPTATPRPSNTPVPACGSPCTGNNNCPSNPGNCNQCLPNGSGGKTCQNAPTPTLTPTSAPACGNTCTTNATCPQNPGGCNQCLPNGSGGKTCQNAPTATPAPACGTPCTGNNNCPSNPGNCNQCLPSSGGGKTCQNPPTPTFTPAPGCGTTCTVDTNCPTTPGGCTKCLPNASGTGKSCQRAPTPTNTPAPGCNSTCTVDTNCPQSPVGGCSKCLPNASGSGKSCQRAPTPTTAPSCGNTCNDNSYCINNISSCTICNLSTKKCSNTSGPTPTTAPACGNPCTTNATCPTNPGGCNLCLPNSSGGKTCQQKPTPTFTPAPGCGTSCTTNGNCPQAPNGCNQCLPNASGSGKSCQQAPSPTPILDCGSTCTRNADCAGARNGCIACVSGKCAVPACGTTCAKDSECAGAKNSCTFCGSNGQCQVAPTATPPFSAAMCHCDGITFTSLTSGQQTTITAHAKVTGNDTSRAQVVSQSFKLTFGTDINSKILARADNVPATVTESSPGLTKYESQWNLKIPELQSGGTYRIFSNINCQPKTSAMNYSSSPSRVVLAAQTQQSILDSIGNFFSGLFGSSTDSSSNPTATNTPTPSIDTSSDNGKLQLETFKPSEVVQNTCTFIIFNVK